MSEHTETPWSYEQEMLGDGVPEWDNYFIFADLPESPIIEGLPRETARRVVSCLNACAGIPTETLETTSVSELLSMNENASEAVLNVDARKAKAEARLAEAERLLKEALTIIVAHVPNFSNDVERQRFKDILAFLEDGK